MTVPAAVSRIDTFKVPPNARDELLQNVRLTLKALSSVPDFVSGEILSSTDNGAPTVVTIVRWRDLSSMSQARHVVMAVHAKHGFDAAKFYERHNIRLDRADYAESETYSPASEAK
jgi:heme-degrading monooxygenase HmoA